MIGHHASLGRFDRIGIGFLQHPQLVVAADHPRLDALNAAGGHPERSRLGPLHEVGLHRLGLALDLEGLLNQRRRRHAADMAVSVVADQHAPDRRGVFQPAGQVDRVAHGREFGRRADLPQQHRPGVDADPHRHL
jgi:hypothetical protein